MAPTIRGESLNDIGQCPEPFYYVGEILPSAVKRKPFDPENVDRLGHSADQIGMGKVRAKTSAGKYVVEFLNKSSIHGLNHISAPRRHFFERVSTVFSITVALGFSVVLSQFAWDHYQNNASSMVLDYDFKHFEITKPAVTMCPFQPVDEDKFPAVFDKFGIVDTPQARKFFLFISKPSYVTLNRTPTYKGAPPENWIDVIRDLYVDFNVHEWDERTLGVSNITTIDIVTEKGMCTTAFGYYGVYSSLDYWRSNNWTIDTVGNMPAWTYDDRDERLTLNDIPKPTELAFHIPTDCAGYDKWYPNRVSGVVDMKIVVQKIQSSDQMRKLFESQRPCNFPDDGNLRMWPVYTRNFCFTECRFNLMRERCGCYPYFARPMRGIPICNITQLHCIGNMASVIVSMKINGSSICNCKVDCDTAHYERLSSTESNSESFPSHFEGLNIDDENQFWIRVDACTSLIKGQKDIITEFLDRRIININVEYPYYIFRYEVFFGFNDFLVSVGGAAGLFVGASIMSFVEVLYYITLRLYWYKKNIAKESRH